MKSLGLRLMDSNANSVVSWLRKSELHSFSESRACAEIARPFKMRIQPSSNVGALNKTPLVEACNFNLRKQDIDNRIR